MAPLRFALGTSAPRAQLCTSYIFSRARKRCLQQNLITAHSARLLDFGADIPAYAQSSRLAEFGPGASFNIRPRLTAIRDASSHISRLATARGQFSAMRNVTIR